TEAALEDIPGDGDVDESAVGFGAAFDAPGSVGPLIGRELLVGAIEDRAELIAAGDPVVGDGDVARCACVAEREARLGADAIIPRRVDGAVGDADVLAAVDVDAIAIGVDADVVDGDVVDPGQQEAEVSAFEDGEVAEENVAAVLERDGLVADASLFRLIHRVVAALPEAAGGWRSSSGCTRSRWTTRFSPETADRSRRSGRGSGAEA